MTSGCGSDDKLFIVCDGMGGHALGDVASSTVGLSISEYWEKNPKCKDSVKKVIDACRQASLAIDKKADSFRQAEMGTTLVLASIEDNKVTIAHCGDSRCYLIRPDVGVVYQAKDHIDDSSGWGAIDKCFFSYHPEAADVEVHEFELLPGDRLFLCTDGTYKAIAPEILKERLMDKKELCDVIDVVKFMCEKYSDDNYSGVLVEVE